jgi:hypothetical protein
LRSASRERCDEAVAAEAAHAVWARRRNGVGSTSRERWDDLRAQLHGVVVPTRHAGGDAAEREILEALGRAAPDFSPARRRAADSESDARIAAAAPFRTVDLA